MTPRKSKREIARAIDSLGTGGDDPAERCGTCGRRKRGTVTPAEFVHYGCVCNVDLPDGASIYTPGGEP